MQRACALREENPTFTSIGREKAELQQPQKLPLRRSSNSEACFTDKSSFWIIQRSAVPELGRRCAGELPLPDVKAQLQGAEGDHAS